MKFTITNSYRKDIDGLRAIAVVSVIVYHFNILPYGFLGVDIFFVISGYLITSIIFKELHDGRFSLSDFYIRRARRILPLTLFLALLSLLTGMFVMLPDDLENLAQSVIATNLQANNILQAIKSQNYWDIANDYKPLLHTWSLGVEAQYYFIYPLLLLVIIKFSEKLLIPIISSLALISIILCFLPYDFNKKFYYLHFRFFELAIGGIAAIYLNGKIIVHKCASVFVCGLILLLSTGHKYAPFLIVFPTTLLLALGIIVSDNNKSKLSSMILQNKLAIALGVISFSLYMWHQIVLSFVQYFILQKLESVHLAMIFVVIIILSIVSYLMIEKPLRNKAWVDNRLFLSLIGAIFAISIVLSVFIHAKAGIIRDVPELGLSKNEAEPNIHKKYNARISLYDRPFKNDENKIKVLVIGNSFARDWANVLLESNFSQKINLSYVHYPFLHPQFQPRAQAADVIFYFSASQYLVDILNIDISKLFVIGTKNFGVNNGYFYNYTGEDYFKQRAFIRENHLINNEKSKQEWGNRYIDILGKVKDQHNTVPVFTPDNKFISQDTWHFTEPGARYFAQLFENELSEILTATIKN